MLSSKPAALVRRLYQQGVIFPTLDQCRAVGRALGDLHVIGSSCGGRCINSRGSEWLAQPPARRCCPKCRGHKLIEDALADDASLSWGKLQV